MFSQAFLWKAIASALLLLFATALVLAVSWLPTAAPVQSQAAATATSPPDQRKPEDNGIPPTPWPTVELPPFTPLPVDETQLTPPPYTPPPTPRPEDPFNVSIAETLVADTEDFVENAEVVALATVKQVLPARWTTPDGSRPYNPWDPANRVYIYTPALLQVEQFLKGGDGVPAQLTVATAGGQVGQDSITYGLDLRVLEAGTQVIVFLRSPRPIEQAPGLPAWLVSARFRVEDGQVHELAYGQGDAGDSGPIPLAAMLEKIRRIADEQRPVDPVELEPLEDIYLPLIP